MKCVTLVAGLWVLLAPFASADDVSTGPSLREIAARYVDSLPSTLSAVQTITPSTALCPTGPSKHLTAGLGAIAGAGLGFALGRGTDRGPLDKEFNGFGLTDSLITAGAIAVALKGYELVESPLPEPCAGDCSPGKSDGLDARVRRSLRLGSAQSRFTANSLSYGTVFATLVLPTAFLASRPHPLQGREFWLTIESGALTGAVLNIVKHRVHRPRPYSRYCVPDCADDLDAHKARVSFFSGHTALAFSFAVSAGTIASMRSYPHAGWVLGSGLALATTTGYLRIAADRHYLTDVLVGAVVGSAIGWAVPKLHGMRNTGEDPASRPTMAVRAIAIPLPVTAADGRLRVSGMLARDGAGLSFGWTY
jgi:membrane-associated phospholipid phosphatase